MNIPPLTIPHGKVVGLSVTLEHGGSDDPAGATEVNLVDEGGGFFAEIKAEAPQHPIRLDGDQLTALAAWVTETCACLDAEREAT